MSSLARRQARLSHYLDHYADFFPWRPLAIVGLMFALGDFVSPLYGLVFGAICLPLYIPLYLALRQARREIDTPRAFNRFAWVTGIVAAVMSVEFAVLCLNIYGYHQGGPVFRSHATLLIIAVIVLTALQAHMTTAAYVAAMAPPVAAFIVMGVMNSRRNGDYNLTISVVLFMTVLIVTTWKQQATDRKLGQLRADLAVRNEDLAGSLVETAAQREAAEAASHAKSRLLATASHEIRTPLNAILGLAEGLRRKSSNDEQRELAEGIVTSGEMLMRLLNAVLDLSRIDAKRARLHPQVFDLSGMLDDVAAIWRPSAEAIGAELTIERVGFDGPCFIEADKGRVEQTLVNLISNALKFSGRTRVTVRAAMDSQVSMLRLEVADRGPGVDKAHRARIFEPFEQTDEGRMVGGAGLGLAICRGNVELLSGRIGLEDTRGGGATFWFAVPIEAAARPAKAVVATSYDEDRPLRVLAAEDNAANRRVIQVLLEPFGVDLTLVENGQEAVEAFAVGRFDLVLMDAQMPVLDGASAVRRIREAEAQEDRRTPIFMLTANVFEEDVARYAEAGVDGVLAKPINLAELAACMAQVRAGSVEPEVEAAREAV